MKMSTLFIAIIGLFVAGAFLLVWFNRQSPEVLNAALPVALGALAALGLVFAFVRPEPISLKFPVAFFLRKVDKLPLAIPDRPFPDMTLVLVDQARHLDPTVLDEPDGSAFGSIAYHNFLQMAIIDWIASRHSGTWRVQVEQFEYGKGEIEYFHATTDASKYKSKVFTREDLEQKFGSNHFARVLSGSGKLAVPLNTELTILPAHSSELQGEIRFKNRFVEVTLKTSPMIGGIGLGQYTELLGFDRLEAQDRFWSEQYLVRANATFTWYLIGHPQMAAQREWAAGIIKGVAHAFGEENLWRQTVANYTLRQHLPVATKNFVRELGPIRSGPPTPAKEEH